MDEIELVLVHVVRRAAVVAFAFDCYRETDFVEALILLQTQVPVPLIFT
jgi:hypothetical protein